MMLSLWTPAAAAEDWKIWSQGDERWAARSISSQGYERYNMKNQGCLVTAIAKILVHSGQQDPEQFNPETCLDAMLDYELLTGSGALLGGARMNTGGFLDQYGPELEYFTDSPHGAWDQQTAYENVSALIAQNCYVIIRAYNYETGNNHFMAVDRAADGTVYVMDNKEILDLYNTKKYNGVTDWLCFRYSGSASYPASGNYTGETGVTGAQSPLLKNFAEVNQYSAGTFLDVAEDAWYCSGVGRSYELGLVQGRGDGSFGVGASFTVAEALTLAARMHSTYYNGSANFEQGDPWYGVYADYCADYGIIAYGQFDDVTRPATRAELAVIFAAALPEQALAGINTVPTGYIPDVGSSDPYANAVYRLYRAGILTGDAGSHNYRPNDKISRQEAACLVARIVDTTLRQRIA